MARPVVTDQGLASNEGDRFPRNEDEHAKLLSWCNNAFQAADSARKPFVTRWEKYYKLYRSYVKKVKGDWRSKMFIPISFWIVETIAPRLVAQLPKFLVNPIGPEDVGSAQGMEKLLEWATTNARPDLYVEMVKQMKSALKYGTGIVKTRYVTDERVAHRRVPDMREVKTMQDQPVTGPDGLPLLNEQGDVVTERVEVSLGFAPVGMKTERYKFEAYDGPVAEWVDIWDFWPAPEAADIETARYVIQRSFQPLKYIQKRIAEGTYQLLEGLEIGVGDTVDTDQALAIRLGLIEQSGDLSDATRKNVELLEFWTDDGRVITMANRTAIIRHADNPFNHGEKPYARIVDHLVEGEFWGVGELEYLEGLQDLQNSLVNQRIDNVRIANNQMFVVNESAITDMDDLVFRPGGVIRTNGQMLPTEVLEPLSVPDVTQGAMNEAEVNERTIEKASGVSSYQQGVDSPSQTDTATGVNAMMEAGATRFGLKVRMAELMGNRTIARHFGSMIQQFTSQEKTVRILGQDGWVFQTFDPASLEGALDYDIESASQVQTEAHRRQESMQNLQVFASYLPPDPMTGGPGQGVLALIEDALRAQGRKDIQRYLPMGPVPQMADPSQQMDPAMQQALGLGQPGGRQEWGMPQPPGALAVNQSASFGPRGANPQAAVFSDLTRENTQGGAEALVQR